MRGGWVEPKGARRACILMIKGMHAFGRKTIGGLGIGVQEESCGNVVCRMKDAGGLDVGRVMCV